MMATDQKPVDRGDYSNGISIETSKVIQGMSLVFTGAMTMLEAIHPKISVEPAELMCLMTGDREGLMKLAEMRKAEDEAKADEQKVEKTSTADADDKEKTNETETPADGPADAAPAVDESADAPVADTAAGVEAPAPTITVDDITKIIVQKIKQNRSNNEKIGQILKAYGAAKVSELPTSKYEAFVTDLSAI